MAVIYDTTLKPTKLELIARWLPTRPWYTGGPVDPGPVRAGGFRLDDPEGEVGIEFIVVNEASGPRPVTCLVPLTYRGAPLEGAEDALLGTMEHGVLGQRWVYDGCHDPVLVAQLLSLVDGRAKAQHQDVSDTPDPEVTRSRTGERPVTAGFSPAAVTVVDGREGTELRLPQGGTLLLHRVLRDAGSALPEEAAGHVGGVWQAPDGTRAQGLFAVLLPSDPASA
jgi:hypothetical protein